PERAVIEVLRPIPVDEQGGVDLHDLVVGYEVDDRAAGVRPRTRWRWRRSQSDRGVPATGEGVVQVVGAVDVSHIGSPVAGLRKWLPGRMIFLVEHRSDILPVHEIGRSSDWHVIRRTTLILILPRQHRTR